MKEREKDRERRRKRKGEGEGKKVRRGEGREETAEIRGREDWRGEPKLVSRHQKFNIWDKTTLDVHKKQIKN